MKIQGKVLQNYKQKIFHPFLNYFLPNKILEEINNSDAIIHFGNFGFKTLKKSFVLIQNILPLVKEVRNSILKVIINRSMKLSNFILIQLDHLKKT